MGGHRRGHLRRGRRRRGLGKLEAHVADVAETMARVPLQAAAQQLARRGRVPVGSRSVRFSRRTTQAFRELAVEGASARQHFEQHASECPDIRALVDRLPRACSGDMYAAVPEHHPGTRHAGTAHSATGRLGGALVSSNAFASPKSSTLTVPSGRSLMLAGFRSR